MKTDSFERRHRIGPAHRAMLLLVGLLPALLLARFPLSGAAFVDRTANHNQASTLVVGPPANVQVRLGLVVLPPSCTATLSWEPSRTPDVVDYEVVRVSQATGVVIEGPWIVSGTSFVNSNLPLTLIGSPWEWKVRSLVLGWHSEWAIGRGNEQIACIL